MVEQGNVVATREALKDSTQLLAVVHGDEYTAEITEQIDKNTSILAEPPRNCDVRTAKEQYERFRDYCYTKKCPSITKDNTFSQIAFMWAQMPYTEGGAKCVNGRRGDPDCRGCEEHCEDVRRRNCINWSGDHCAKTSGIFCPVSCSGFRAYKPQAETEKGN